MWTAAAWLQSCDMKGCSHVCIKVIPVGKGIWDSCFCACFFLFFCRYSYVGTGHAKVAVIGLVNALFAERQLRRGFSYINLALRIRYLREENDLLCCGY